MCPLVITLLSPKVAALTNWLSLISLDSIAGCPITTTGSQVQVTFKVISCSHGSDCFRDVVWCDVGGSFVKSAA